MSTRLHFGRHERRAGEAGRRPPMRAYFGTVMLLALGCDSVEPKTRGPSVGLAVPPSRPLEAEISQTERWPAPPMLPTFGAATGTSIRVVVFGVPGAVQRPGYYYLPHNSVVRDAVQAAQGLGPRVYSGASGVERRRREGCFEFIRFKGFTTVDLQLELRDGDKLYFGCEYY
jgi:hypothetical protein